MSSLNDFDVKVLLTLYNLEFAIKSNDSEEKSKKTIQALTVTIDAPEERVRLSLKNLKEQKLIEGLGSLEGVVFRLTHKGLNLIESSLLENQEEKRKSSKANLEKGSQKKIRIFISHSSEDENLAQLLLDLLKFSLTLKSSEIRCTSVAGHKLPVGSHIEEQLRSEVLTVPLLVGLISNRSLESAYVLFELGARWGIGKPIAPLLASDIDSKDLPGPLKSLNALSSTVRPDLEQFVADISEILEVELDKPAANSRFIDAILKFNLRGKGKRKSP